MNIFIKKAFAKSLHHFGVLPNPPPRNLFRYFFDLRYLTEGEAPNDRGCRACGKIGHLVRDCPKKKDRKDDEKPAKKPARKEKKRSPVEEKAPSPIEPPPPAPPKPKLSDESPNDLMAVLSGLGIVDGGDHKASTADGAISAQALEESLLSDSKPKPSAPPGFQLTSLGHPSSQLFPSLGLEPQEPSRNMMDHLFPRQPMTPPSESADARGPFLSNLTPSAAPNLFREPFNSLDLGLPKQNQQQ